MIYTQGVPQIGSRKQHGYIITLAQKAGYEDLRQAVYEHLQIPLNQIGEHNFDTFDASRLIDSLKGGLSDEGEYLDPLDSESPDREVPGTGGVGW